MSEFNDFRALIQKDTIVILDTNILLNIYNFPFEYSQNIIDVLKPIKDKIWLPNQVYVEYNSNKNRVKGDTFSKYQKIEREISKGLQNISERLGINLASCDKFRYIEIGEIIKKIMDNIEENKRLLSGFDVAIRKEQEQCREWNSQDCVNNFISDLIQNGQVGKEFSFTELIKIYIEGDVRFNLAIPPGYKDKKKGENTDNPSEKKKKYGDLILWKEILLKAKEDYRPILFVTDDCKSDWWARNTKENSKNGDSYEELIGPREELLKEFSIYSENKSSFYMINLVNFLGCIDDVSTEFSSTLNFEIHKVELLKQFIDNQIKLDDISYEYILEILDEIFNYEASNYNLSLGEILIDDNSVSLNYFEENINIFGNFNLSLNVEGILNDIDTDLFIEEDYNEREESKIIAIEIEFCCKVEYKLDENHKIKRDAAIGEFFLLNILNKEIIPIMPDNIDIYELYDLKLYSEYNFNDEIYYKMSNPRYRKLVEDIEFISYEDLRLE